MRTKEECLTDVKRRNDAGPFDIGMALCKEAMDEYSKERCFDFYGWVNKERYWQHSNGVWYKGSHMSQDDPFLTNEQLFNLYQQEKSSLK